MERVEVTAPVALHVAAKRYLCAVDPAYLAGLAVAPFEDYRPLLLGLTAKI